MAPENYQDTKQYKKLLYFEFSAIQKKSIWLDIKSLHCLVSVSYEEFILILE